MSTSCALRLLSTDEHLLCLEVADVPSCLVLDDFTSLLTNIIEHQVPLLEVTTDPQK